jgi:hypothetical protein
MFDHCRRAPSRCKSKIKNNLFGRGKRKEIADSYQLIAVSYSMIHNVPNRHVSRESTRERLPRFFTPGMMLEGSDRPRLQGLHQWPDPTAAWD